MAKARVDYRAYLKSPEWRSKRAKVLDRAGGWCERCRTRRALHIHHKTYARLGDEKLTDLEALCAGCHVREHPDKVDLQRGAFLGDAECACGSTSAEIYVGSNRIYTVCIECGEAGVKKRRPQRRKRKGGKRRGKQGVKEPDAAAEEERQRKKLAADMKRAAAKIDRRYGIGRRKFGEY